MDIIHHTLIGGTGFLIASNVGQPLIGVAFVVGSVFPDLDVFFMALGKRFYLRNHQALTHSLLLAPIYAGLLNLMLVKFLEFNWDWLIYCWFLCGLLLHIVLDWCNTFRIALLFPLTKKRFSLDVVFFIDIVLLALTCLFYLLYGWPNLKYIIYLYPIFFISYLVFKYYLHQYVVRKCATQFVIPSAINPFEFYILEQKNDGNNTYIYNSYRSTSKKHQFYPYISSEYSDLAQKSQVFQDMQKITRAFYLVKVIHRDDKIQMIAVDLAIRNFKGEFSKTELIFNRQGDLIDEMAHI